MAEEQQAPAKPSLIERVFGSRIAQAIGILGVAYTLFSGLEPFLKFSRFMAYLVNHWRSLTRGLWMWLASFVDLELPAWALDLTTLLLFILLFTLRGFRDPVADQHFFDRSLVARAVKFVATKKPLKSSFREFIGLSVVTLTGVFVVPFAIFLTMHVHLGSVWAVGTSSIIAILYLITLILSAGASPWGRVYGVFKNSERAMLVLLSLLTINYVALHSHSIEAFIKKATQ